jgi:hypothetical protein
MIKTQKISRVILAGRCRAKCTFNMRTTAVSAFRKADKAKRGPVKLSLWKLVKAAVIYRGAHYPLEIYRGNLVTMFSSSTIWICPQLAESLRTYRGVYCMVVLTEYRFC